MRKLLFVIHIVISFFVSAQDYDANSLMTFPTIDTVSEMLAISNPNVGSVVYIVEDENIYRYTGTTNGWQKGLGSTSSYSGYVIINSTHNGNSIDVENLPFKPSNITFVAHANIEDFGINNDNATRNNDRGIRNSFASMNGYARQDGDNIEQGVISIGSHGNSINDISRYSSDSQAIGIRYGDQNGIFLGSITGTVSSFNQDGFSLTINYTVGDETNTSYTSTTEHQVLPEDIYNEGLLIFYTAHK